MANNRSSFKHIDGWNAEVTLKGSPPSSIGGIARVDDDENYVFAIETVDGRRVSIELKDVKDMKFYAPGENDEYDEVEVTEERIYR